MKTARALFPLLVLVLAAAMVSAQDNGEAPAADTPITGTAPATPSRTAPATPGGSARPADTDRELIDTLMGETGREKPKPKPKPAAPKPGATTATPREPVDEPAATTRETPPVREEAPRVEREPDDSAVPEVPVVDERDLAEETAAEEPPLFETIPEVGTDAPMSDYRDSQYPEDDTGLPAEEQATEAAAVPGPTSSPGSAVVIGLIMLAVLLVALAAVVGIMAAQRGRTERETPLPPDAPVWAYLTAPGAPNISLAQTPFLMGSAEACALRLQDPKASPQHARVDRTEDGFILSDLNSTNGTFLNGERIASPVSLRPGDEIQMGDITITFEVYE